MKFFKKQSFNDFLQTSPDLSKVEDTYISEWNKRSFFAQMLDAWGEMNYTHQAFIEYKNSPTEEKKIMLLIMQKRCMKFAIL